MNPIIEQQLKEAMVIIINRFKQTPEGFCCADSDYRGMFNFLARKESEEAMSEEWQKAIQEVTPQITLIKTFIENEAQGTTTAGIIVSKKTSRVSGEFFLIKNHPTHSYTSFPGKSESRPAPHVTAGLLSMDSRSGREGRWNGGVVFSIYLSSGMQGRI